jgi:hypothetical protein
MVSAKVAYLAFHAALLIASRRIAELCLKAPVRAEGDQAFRLLSLMAAQNLLHRALQVVVAQATEHATKVVKRQFVRFQKGLLCGVIVGHVKRSPTGHRAHRKNVNPQSFAREVGHGFVPIHLRLPAPVVNLRHERFPPRES